MKINSISGSVLKIDLSNKENPETKLGSVSIIPRSLQSHFTAKARLLKQAEGKREIIEILLSPRKGTTFKLKTAKANIKYYLEKLECLKNYEFKFVDALPVEEINNTKTRDESSAELRRAAAQTSLSASTKTA